MKFLPCLLFLLSSAIGRAELIPAARLTDWTPGTRTGVPGGIDQYLPGGASERVTLIDVTDAPCNADPTGVVDCTAAVAALISDTWVAMSGNLAGVVFYFPTGTYKLDSQLAISHSLDNMTIRGDGPGLTIIDAGARFIAFSPSGWVGELAAITAGLTKDSTSITLDDASAFVAGDLILMGFENMTDNTALEGGAVITLGVGGSLPTVPVRQQVSRVTGKAGDVLTISPGIYHSPQAGLSAQVRREGNGHVVQGVGIEDMTVAMRSGNTTTSPIQIQRAYGCWVKNVKVPASPNYGIEIFDSLQCEMRECWIEDVDLALASNHAGFLVNTCAGLLIEDNVVLNKFPGIEVNAGTCGSAIAHNLFESEPDPIYDSIGAGIISNHGPHNSHNLYEGNISSSIMSDGYFGSASEDTIHRNWFHGTDFNDSGYNYPVALKRFTRNYNIAGNIIGKAGLLEGAVVDYGRPNIGNGDFTGTAQPTVSADFWNDWKATATLTTRTSDTAGEITLISGAASTGQLLTIRWDSETKYATFTAGTVAGAVVPFSSTAGDVLPAASTVVNVYMQPGGYQERDLDVEASTTEKGNYLYGTDGAAGSMSSLGGDTLPDSFFRSAKPTYFGALAWPAFDPASPVSDYEAIPAGYRWINAASPPAPSGGTATATSITVSGTLSIGP